MMTKLERAALVAPEGYALVSIAALKAWGKYDEVRNACQFPAEQSDEEPMYISESCAQRGCACHYSVEVDGEPVTVYAAPVRTKDLTDDEIMKINVDTAGIVPTCDRQFHFARAVIAADREKNNV